ncbi:MAG: CtsR family transcriptional regulator [Clostridia bacterium]
MATLSDAIEAYLLARLDAEEGVLEIQRGELAERFGCVPSQVTYVLVTRFTPERGFLVEARRGGGGGIRITRLQSGVDDLLALLGDLWAIDQARAQNLIERFLQASIISTREAVLMVRAVDRTVLDLDLPERDRLRARLLRAMLASVLAPEARS